MRKTFEVTLLNQKFNLKSDQDERYVQRVSDYVNKKLFEIQQKTKSVSSLNVALLTALNIADEYFTIRSGKKVTGPPIKERVQELIKTIDRYLES